MAEKAGRQFAKVYKISQNRDGTLHSLGASPLSFLSTPFVRAGQSKEYRYCEFSIFVAKFQINGGTETSRWPHTILAIRSAKAT